MNGQPIEQSKILKRMLARLHAALASGPLLSCRPHSSRQRIDLTLLGKPEGPRPDQILPGLIVVDGRARSTMQRDAESGQAVTAAATGSPSPGR